MRSSLSSRRDNSQGCQPFIAVKIYQDGNNIKALTIENDMKKPIRIITYRLFHVVFLVVEIGIVSNIPSIESRKIRLPYDGIG